jgi:hypothetical protein
MYLYVPRAGVWQWEEEGDGEPEEDEQQHNRPLNKIVG